MLCKADYKYFDRARQVAGMSDCLQFPIGCVAVYKGRLVGAGCNTHRTHPVQKYYNRYRNISCYPSLHAEINCLNSIRNLEINFSKVSLYVYRKRRDRPHGLARPCPSCMAAIKDLGIHNIYYTTDSGYAYEEVMYDVRNLPPRSMLVHVS